MLKRRLGMGIALCGLILIVFSFHAHLFWKMNTPEYFSLREAGFVYGLLFMILGIVLIVKNISILQFLWLSWSGLIAIQFFRIYIRHGVVSQFMNSVEVFWAVLIFGGILTIFSIWYKWKKIL